MERYLAIDAFPWLSRYVRSGVRRLRRFISQVDQTPLDEADRLMAQHFDAAYYLAQNIDVELAGVDPLSHFLTRGWREGRDPNSEFSIEAYCSLNPDVPRTANPFAHYLTTGQAEGRGTKQSLGFRHDIIARLAPMEQRLEAYRAPERQPSSAESLARALATSRSGMADLHLSVSHDNYTENIGGVQLCLIREALGLAEDGVDHIHLFPSRIYPTVRTGPNADLIGVLWNGTHVGNFEPAALVAALAALPIVRRGTFALHSLLGHSADDILSILQAAEMKAGFFWLHDFASLCAGFHLMRNDVVDCGAPPPGSAACSVCIYGPYRETHVAAHRKLFEALDLTVVAPSEGTLCLWRATVDFPHVGEFVRPHADLVHPWRSRPLDSATPVRIAFVGTGAAHKGWPVFEELALRFRDDPRYRFVHLGRSGPRRLPIEQHDVTVTSEHPDAMRDALKAHDIDAALIWPLCRETFSLTAHEAAAAGVAVLTHRDSGNVAAFVEEGGFGYVLADERALMEMFESGEAQALSRAARDPLCYDLVFGRLTADLRSGA